MATFNFSPTSRYYGIETATRKNARGETVVYIRRRFLPQTDRFFLIREHTVAEGERLDHIANQHIGDPEAFWRIADANTAMRPEALTEIPGRRLKITLPEGIPGTPNA